MGNPFDRDVCGLTDKGAKAYEPFAAATAP